MHVVTQYASVPCKYENCQRLQFATEFIKTKISTVLFYTVKAMQSTAEYGRRLCLFCPSNKMTFDLTLKVVSESRVTWATSVPILVFLDLSVLDLGPMYVTYRRQTDNVRRQIVRPDVRQKHHLMPPPCGGRGIIIIYYASALWGQRHNNHLLCLRPVGAEA